MPYRPADPALQEEYVQIISSSEVVVTPRVRLAANDLALRLRSRLIDLATWKADCSPEYREIESQCRQLTKVAGPGADPLLLHDFGEGKRPGP